MKTKLLIRLSLVLYLGCLPYRSAFGDHAEDEAAIRQAAATYVEAFNKQDAKAIASLWSPEAVYSNPRTGDEVVGRDAIEKQLVAIFADSKGAKLEVTVNSVQFVSPNVAIEEGTARVISPSAEPDETVYSAVHVKRDGKWLVDRMSEESVPVIYSNYNRLKDLEWMIGNWVDQDDEARIETTCHWTKNQNFINRAFTVSIKDQIELSGIQIIGWDSASQKIRSWVFDSDGGFGEATWTKKDNRWVINAASTLPDGRKASAINIMTLLDENTITWQATGRAVGGEILPNIDPIKITKKTAAEQ